MKNRLESMRAVVVAFTCLVAAMATLPAAADVVLNPGYISGTLQVNGQTVTQASVYANWYDPVTQTNYSASTSLNGAGSYTLTVNVPEGSTPTYSVNATIYLNGYSFYLSPPSQSVAVTALQTSTVDFNIDPAFVQGTVTSTGEAASSMYLNVFGNSSASGSGSGNTLTIPVTPCTNSPQCLQVSGQAYFPSGVYVGLETRYGSAGPGQTASFEWTVTPPTERGDIAGNISLSGATAAQHSVQASGPSSGYVSLNGDGSYQMPNLLAGSYYTYAYSYFNNNGTYSSYLSHPDSSFSPSRNVSVTGGASTTLNISNNAAFLQGTVTLTGSKPLSQWQSAGFNAYGMSGTASSGGYAGTSLNPQNGAYAMVVTEGGWNLQGLSLYLNAPTSYASLNFYDYQTANTQVNLAAGETATRNFTYGTGTVTLNYIVNGGGTLSSPYLYGSCYERDANNQTKWYYSVNAQSYQTNVNPGSVTFYGMAGDCQLEAYAQVGGSNTKFGNVNVTVVPGSSQEVDIGAPALTLTFPPADYVTSNASITVTGTAVDDVAVDSVTVNGQAAALSPAAPAAAVSFSAPVSLNAGPNTIHTTATDTSGKNASDTRTVYRDVDPPTLSWIPPDGSSFQVPSVAIAGTANDDAGIKAITVNAVPIAFTATGNGNEVTFSVPFTLLPGVNFIEVVATDVSNKTTAQTHKVSYGVDSTAPSIIPSVSGTLVNGWYTSDVTVTWSVVDNESAITSTSGCGTTGITADTAGTTLTCTATSAGGTASGSVTIRRDTSRPVISGMPAASCSLWPPNHRMVRVATIGASDAGSGLNGGVQISVASNESVNGGGDGNTSPDWIVGADGSVQLRAERAGNGNGRVYTIRASARDAAGNERVATGTCTVPHDQR